MVPGQSLPPNGKPLGRLDVADLYEVIQKVRSLTLYCMQLWMPYIKGDRYFSMKIFWVTFSGEQCSTPIYCHNGICLSPLREWRSTVVITESWIFCSSGKFVNLCPGWIGSWVDPVALFFLSAGVALVDIQPHTWCHTCTDVHYSHRKSLVVILSSISAVISRR